MDSASTTGAVTLTIRAGRATGVPTFARHIPCTTATLTPTAALANNTSYTATVGTAAQAADGVALANPASWTFTTANNPPTVTGHTPTATSGVATSVAPTATLARKSVVEATTGA